MRRPKQNESSAACGAAALRSRGIIVHAGDQVEGPRRVQTNEKFLTN